MSVSRTALEAALSTWSDLPSTPRITYDCYLRYRSDGTLSISTGGGDIEILTFLRKASQEYTESAFFKLSRAIYKCYDEADDNGKYIQAEVNVTADNFASRAKSLFKSRTSDELILIIAAYSADGVLRPFPRVWP